MNALDIVIPCKALDRGKSRLAPVLDAAARQALCLRLLRRTLRRARALGGRMAVVSDDPAVAALALAAGALSVPESGGGLNAALAAGAAALPGAGPLLVLPVDLPRATPAVLRRFLARSAGHELVLAPDRSGDGTNLLLLAGPLRAGFVFAYGPGSASRHFAAARARGIEPLCINDPRLAFDLDEPADLRRLRQMS